MMDSYSTRFINALRSKEYLRLYNAGTLTSEELDCIRINSIS